MAVKSTAKQRKKSSQDPDQIQWLPFDSRLIPPIFSFSHVHGAARVFLEIEIIIATLVVLLTLIIAIGKVMMRL